MKKIKEIGKRKNTYNFRNHSDIDVLGIQAKSREAYRRQK